MKLKPCSRDILDSRRRRAFTLIELLVVIAIFVVIGTVTFTSYFGARNATDLKDASAQIVAMLREAQSRSVSNYEGVAWGVHFANTTSTTPFYALFYASYASSQTVSYYTLPTSVAYTTSTLTLGTSTNIIFTQLSGISSASTSIGLYSKVIGSLSSTTISISGAGTVSF